MEKIKIIILIFVGIFMFGTSSNCQTVKLSKQEMYAEMDSLISIIEKANPHLEIYKKAMNFDVIEELKKQREKIKDVKNIYDFYNLIDYSISIIPEVHSRFIRDFQLKKPSFFVENYPEIFDKSTIKNICKIEKKQKKDIKKMKETYFRNMSKYIFKLSYFDGEYHLTCPRKIFRETDTIIINAGQILTKINDIPVHDFFKQNREDYDFVMLFGDSKTRWDFTNKRFYNEGITMPFSFIMNKTPMYLTFVDKTTNQEIKFSMLNQRSDFSVMLGDQNTYERKKTIVRMIDSVLFIKIPTMKPDDMPFYEEEISKVAKDKEIKKVIIDVRGNKGGSDNVWHHVLSLITDTTLCRHANLGFNNNSILEQNLSYPVDSFLLYHDSRLNKDYRLLSLDEDCNNINPHEKSIRYNGKIYVLHDRNSFSSSAALLAFALTNDKVVAVGTPTGTL